MVRSLLLEHADGFDDCSHSGFVIGTEDGRSVGFDDVAFFDDFDSGGGFNRIEVGTQEDFWCGVICAGEFGDDVSRVAADFRSGVIFVVFQAEFDEEVLDVIDTFALLE